MQQESWPHVGHGVGNDFGGGNGKSRGFGGVIMKLFVFLLIAWLVVASIWIIIMVTDTLAVAKKNAEDIAALSVPTKSGGSSTGHENLFGSRSLALLQNVDRGVDSLRIDAASIERRIELMNHDLVEMNRDEQRSLYDIAATARKPRPDEGETGDGTSGQCQSHQGVLPDLTPFDKMSDTSSTEVNWAYAPNVPSQISRNHQRKWSVAFEAIGSNCTIAPGVVTEAWYFQIAGETIVDRCSVPGPVLRGRVGDMVEVTLTNLHALGTEVHPHNIDFHAATGQGGGAHFLAVDEPEEGEEPHSATIRFRLLYPGAFFYHCAFGDVPIHIAHGMYGLFIVEPEVPLPRVDHEWAVVQSEWYLTKFNKSDEQDSFHVHSCRNLLDEHPSHITFNGHVGALTATSQDPTRPTDGPLEMSVGERARIYFINAGADLSSSFHPIGSHWDLVWPEGATHPCNRVVRGSQTTVVGAGGATVVEVNGLVRQRIILLDHAISRPFYKGALGFLDVDFDASEINTAPEQTEIFQVVDFEPFPHAVHQCIAGLDDDHNGNGNH